MALDSIRSWTGHYLPDEIVPRHSHPHAQLILAANGTLLVGTDQGTWLIPSGAAVWIPDKIEHDLRAVDEFDGISLFVAADARPRLPRECIVITVTPLLRELIKSIALIKPSADICARDLRLYGLLLDEIENHRALSLWLPTPADPKLSALCRSLLVSPDKTARLSDCARAVNMSARSLSRHFQKQCGMSFGQWLRRASLIASIAPLSRGVPILQVAFDRGYSSPSAFTAMFRRTLGQSPRDFFRDQSLSSYVSDLDASPILSPPANGAVEFLRRPIGL